MDFEEDFEEKSILKSAKKYQIPTAKSTPLPEQVGIKRKISPMPNQSEKCNPNPNPARFRVEFKVHYLHTVGSGGRRFI